MPIARSAWLAARRASEQAERAGAVDRLGARVRAEFCVDVADVGPDGVDREVQLRGNFGRREVAGQVAEHLELACAEGFFERTGCGEWCDAAVEDVDDVGEELRVG